MDYRRRWQQARLRRARLRGLIVLAALLIVGGMTAAVRYAGERGPLWIYRPAEPGPVRFGFSADGGLLVAVWQGGRLQGLDAAGGREIEALRFHSPFPLLSPPLVLPTAVVFGADDGVLRSLDLSTTRLRWELRTGGPIRDRPHLAGDLVLVGSDDGRLYGAEVSTGALLWQVDCGGRIGAEVGTPAPGWVVVGTGGNGVLGIRYARRDSEDGAPQWPAAAAWRRGVETPVLSPVATDPASQQALVGSDGGLVLLLQGTSGEVLERRQFPDVVRSRPILRDGRAVAADRGGLIVAWTPGGEVRWTRRVRGGVTTALAATSEAVYLGTGAGQVMAFRLSDGHRLWRGRLPAPAAGNLQVAGDLVVVGLADGTLCAFRLPEGG